TEAISLAHVEVTYWLDAAQDGEAGEGDTLVFHCDWAAVGCSNVMGTFGSAEDGTRFLRIPFRPGAGGIASGEDSGEIKVRFNRADWAPIGQEGHYSFHPVAEYETWERVTLAVDGQPVWGAPPVSDGTAEEAVTEATGTATAPPTEMGSEVDVILVTST